MAEKQTSDAVRITRIVAPTALIIALALIFKSELSGSMNRGCFEISIEHAGIDMKDQSLCSMNDVNQFAGNMTEIGAVTAEKRADSAFAEFEQLLVTLNKEKEELLAKYNEAAVENNKYEEMAFELAREMENQMRRLNNREATVAVNQVYNQFVEAFDVPPVRLAEEVQSIEPVEPVNVHSAATDIRTRYVKKTEVEVEQVQQHIKVKRK